MNTRFEIEPGYADALRAAGLADFDALFNAPAGPPTSKHKHRETVPIEFDVNGERQRFFLKRVFKVPGQHSWRPWLRGKPRYSQPAREWDNIKMMRDAGLPVMKRVAVGERRKFGIPVQAFILVEDVGMQWTLENWLIPGFPKPPGIEKIDTNQIWFELGKLQRKLDLAGINWPDADNKHVYTEPIGPAGASEVQWRFALIDVERAYADMPLSENRLRISKNKRKVAGELRSQLQAQFPFWGNTVESAHYLAGRNDQPPILHPLCTEPALPWAKNLRCALPTPEHYVHPRAQCVNWKSGIKSSESERLMLSRIGIQSVESAFTLRNPESLKKSGLQSHRDRLRVKVEGENGSDVVLYVKRFRRPPLRDQIRRMLEADRTHSTAYWEYQIARRLMEIGIPTMQTVAVGEEMTGWIENRSFVATASVEGESLETLARRWKSDPDSKPQLREFREVIYRVAFLKNRLRSWHYYHRDLYLSHIFLSQNAKGEMVVQLIDLARVLQKPWFELRWEIKDLAALAHSVPPGLLTRTDHLRFLRAMGHGYLLTPGQLRSHPAARATRKALLHVIRLVNRRVAKMARHDARRAARFEKQHATQASSAPAEEGRYS